MRRWWSDALSAAGHVADRPLLWLPGALAWTAGVGWLALVIGVARPPNIGALTFGGARFFGSGAWPWNAVAIGAAGLAAALIGFALVSAAEAVLLRGRNAVRRDAARIFVLGLVCAAPTLAGLLAVATAAVVVAPVEFNAPDQQLGPLGRTAIRLGPLLVATAVAASAGAAIHASAARSAVAGRTVAEALRGSPRQLAGAGARAVVQAAAMLMARVAYLAVAAIGLRVLWAPIGLRLEAGGMDPAVGLLLVGFVAIWLCLVLGGGALHAWGSTSWTRVLGRSRERMETTTGP